MIHLLVTAIITVILTFLRGAVSVIGFLLRLISNVLRLLFCALPLTGAALILTCIYLVAFACTGADFLPAELPWRPAGAPFSASMGAMLLMVHDLRAAAGSELTGALIIAAAVVLFLPVTLALLLAHAFIALLPVLLIVMAADVVFCLLCGILTRKTPFAQMRDRFYTLFPRQADRHYERTWHSWLKRHAQEFEDDTFGQPAMRSAFIDDRDPRYPGDAEEEAPAGDERRIADRRAEKRRRQAERADRERRRIEEYYEEDYEDNCEEEGEEEELFEEEEAEEETWTEQRFRRASRRDTAEDGSRRRSRRAEFFDFDEEEEPDQSGAPRSSFNFFAGCRDRESVERKYRSLVKIYHPDNQDGDTSAIQEINAQYSEAKRRFAQIG